MYCLKVSGEIREFVSELIKLQIYKYCYDLHIRNNMFLMNIYSEVLLFFRAKLSENFIAYQANSGKN